MDILKLLSEILKSDAGSFSFIFLLLGGVGFLIWKVSHFHTKYEDLDKMEKRFDNKFNQMEDKFEKKFDRIEGKFADIKDDLSIIKAFIELQKDKANPLAQRQSPIRLTQAGIEVEKDIKAKDLVDKYWNDIINKVNKKLNNNCNPYDIQVASFEVGDTYQSFVSDKELDTIKLHAYNHGYDLGVYELLFGIIIRDKVLEERGINTDEIDNHDPNITK